MKSKSNSFNFIIRPHKHLRRFKIIKFDNHLEACTTKLVHPVKNQTFEETLFNPQDNKLQVSDIT